MLKAGSLIYSIFISLIVGILCYALLLIYSLNLNLENHFQSRLDLLDHNRFALTFLETYEGDFEDDFSPDVFEENRGVETKFKIVPWGIFNRCEVYSTSGKDKVRRDFLIARERSNNEPVLYLRNDGSELKIAGKTQIKGDIYLPEGGIEKKTISGHSGSYQSNHQGKVFKANDLLPKVEQYRFVYPEEIVLIDETSLVNESLFQPFSKETAVLPVNGVLSGLTIKGNVIIQSKDTLYVQRNMVLEDVIIDAPKVVFKEGFKGNVQVYAKLGIEVEREVSLAYPSALFIGGGPVDMEKSIVIGEDVEIRGAVVLEGNGIVGQSKHHMKIGIGSKIYGDVYCDGQLTLDGQVQGSIWTSSFLHETNSTRYENLVFNAEIGSLPKELEYFRLLTIEKEKTPWIIIKKV